MCSREEGEVEGGRRELKKIKQAIMDFQEDKHTSQILKIIDVALLKADIKADFHPRNRE
jgi:hypothetical protein